jgi:hypothetical protein
MIFVFLGYLFDVTNNADPCLFTENYMEVAYKKSPDMLAFVASKAKEFNLLDHCLKRALEREYLERAETLIKLGANLNSVYESVIVEARRTNRNRIVEWLLKTGNELK